MTHEDNRLNGPYINYYKNGKYPPQKREEFMYRNDVLEGPCQSWYANANKKAEYNCVAGKQEGIYTLFDMDGNVKKQRNYVNGRVKKN